MEKHRHGSEKLAPKQRDPKEGKTKHTEAKNYAKTERRERRTQFLVQKHHSTLSNMK